MRDLPGMPRFAGARRGRRVLYPEGSIYGISAVFPFVGRKGRYWQESELVLLWFLFQAGVVQPERDPTLPRTPFGGGNGHAGRVMYSLKP